MLALAIFIATEARAQSEMLLSDVTIVDVIEGTLTSGQSVLIRDGMSAEIGEDIASDTATPVDGAGGYSRATAVAGARLAAVTIVLAESDQVGLIGWLLTWPDAKPDTANRPTDCRGRMTGHGMAQ